jgi:pimeloyl-ACP methyl ester carboxylesterase
MHQGIFRIGRAALVAALTVVALVGVSTTKVTTPADAAQPSSTYEVFTGSVDDFYHVPDPLPPGAPGTLIRVQTVSTSAESTTMRIMYHSVDGAGRDRAVTGTLTFPNGPAPTDGWPVMSIANGTVGLGPKCAPSRGDRGVYDFGIGGVAVASDYIGEGPVGEVQAYLSRSSEGHSVLDAVRAARNYGDAHAGSRFVVLGGSQGGHGALSASELAPTYAPELDLLGTVALAPAAMFDRTYGALDEIVTRVVTAMGMVGLASEHPEIDLADYASPAALDAFAQMRTECREEIISTVLGVPGEFFTHDPRTTEPARSIMLANDVGNVAAPSPVFHVQGTADVTVDPRRTDDLFARMCGVGQVTEYLKVPGADHGNVTQMAMTEIQDWLAARLAGEPAPDTCGEAPPVTTTTTTSAPPTTPPSSTSTLPVSTTAPTASSTSVAVAPVAQQRGGSSGSGSAGGEGTLATTGTRTSLLGAIALGCVAAGAVLVAAERRRFSRR